MIWVRRNRRPWIFESIMKLRTKQFSSILTFSVLAVDASAKREGGRTFHFSVCWYSETNILECFNCRWFELFCNYIGCPVFTQKLVFALKRKLWNTLIFAPFFRYRHFRTFFWVKMCLWLDRTCQDTTVAGQDNVDAVQSGCRPVWTQHIGRERDRKDKDVSRKVGNKGAG